MKKDLNFNNNESIIKNEAVQLMMKLEKNIDSKNHKRTKIILLSYVFVKTYDNNVIYSYEEIVSNIKNLRNDVVAMFNRRISKEEWDICSQILKDVDNYEVFKYLPIVALQDCEIATPYSVINLANKILDIKEEDRLLDAGCGYGTYIAKSFNDGVKANYNACELLLDEAIISYMVFDMIGVNCKLENTDIFNLVNNDEKFDKIFFNYSFKYCLNNSLLAMNHLKKWTNKFPEITKTVSSDWLYNSLLLDLINEDGKAIAIMTNGSAFNGVDAKAREYFVEHGYIEAVISLPGNLFNNTNIPTSMIVISKNNESVRFVDASNIYHKTRRRNEINDEDIDTIYNLLKKDCENSKVISKEELRKNDYVLYLGRYTNISKEIENGVSFSDLIKNITRGSSIKASELDLMSSNLPTKYQYLMLQNINDGIIDEELPYLTSLDSKYEKYVIKNRNLIISKNGYPYKIAVLENECDKKILANGNLFVIELDEEKVNPYYLKVYFDSEDGMAALKSISAGTSILNIGVENLKSLIIPLKSKEEQNEIAKKYLELIDEIKSCKKRIDNANEEIHFLINK